MIMTNDANIEKVTPQYTFITCPNCYGYGAKGNPPRRILCPSCKGKGVLQVALKERDINDLLTKRNHEI